MLKRAGPFLVVLVAVACTTTAPSPTPTTAAIGFGGVPPNGSAITTYSESGLSVLATTGSWISLTTYGHPAPFIEFFTSGGNTIAGEVRIVADGDVFSFKSVDLYSSVTRIPYTITGLRNFTALFTLTDTVPNTLGNFVTVTNPHADTIDTLVIRLTNEVPVGATNPMGIDNIIVTRQ